MERGEEWCDILVGIVRVGTEFLVYCGSLGFWRILGVHFVNGKEGVNALYGVNC